MKKIFTSIAKRSVALMALIVGVAVQAEAGQAWYAQYAELEAYPTGAGKVYAAGPEDYNIDTNTIKWQDKCEIQYVSTSQAYYGYAQPADGWQLAGFSAATLAEDGMSFEFSDFIIDTNNPGYLSVEGGISDDPSGEASDSTTTAGLMPLDPIAKHYALFTRVKPVFAPGQTSLGTLTISKVCNDLGDEVTLTAIPNEPYEGDEYTAATSGSTFDHWELNGEVVSREAEITITVTELAQYVAYFTAENAQDIDFGEGRYIHWYGDSISTDLPENVKALSFMPDSARISSLDGKDNFIAPYRLMYAPACQPVILYGTGRATLVSSPVAEPWPSEDELNRYAQTEILVDTLAKTHAYYNFNESDASFVRIADGQTIEAGKVYLALPDSVYKNAGLTDAPQVVYTDYEAAVANGITNVKTINTASGRIYTIGGQPVSSMDRPGIYIIEGKKVLYRKE